MKSAHPIPQSFSPRRTTYECPFMQIVHCRADFGAFAKDYYVVGFKRRGGVVILHDDSVLLVRQYRYLLNDYSWELPGGTIEDSENAEDGLIRECLEETGVRPKELLPLVVYYPGLDNVDNRTSVYYSRGATVGAPFKSNPAEIVEIAWIPYERCLDMVFRGQILDAMSVAGLLAYDARVNRNGGNAAA